MAGMWWASPRTARRRDSLNRGMDETTRPDGRDATEPAASGKEEHAWSSTGAATAGPAQPGLVSGLTVEHIRYPAGDASVAERYFVTGPDDRATPVYADVLADGSYRVIRANPRGYIASDDLFMRIMLAVDAHRARAGHAGEWRPLGDLEERLACGGGRVPRPEGYTQALLNRRYGDARNEGREWYVPVSDRDTAEHAAASLSVRMPAPAPSAVSAAVPASLDTAGARPPTTARPASAARGVASPPGSPHRSAGRGR